MIKFVICILFAALFLAVTVNAQQVEYAPGERAAEVLFNMGLRGPWLISEHAPWLYGDTTRPGSGFSYRFYDTFGRLSAEYRDRRYSSFRSVALKDRCLLGYVVVDSGMLSVLDADTAAATGVVKIYTKRGTYPVMALVDANGKLEGVYIDLRSAA